MACLLPLLQSPPSSAAPLDVAGQRPETAQIIVAPQRPWNSKGTRPIDALPMLARFDGVAEQLSGRKLDDFLLSINVSGSRKISPRELGDPVLFSLRLSAAGRTDNYDIHISPDAQLWLASTGSNPMRVGVLRPGKFEPMLSQWPVFTGVITPDSVPISVPGQRDQPKPGEAIRLVSIVPSTIRMEAPALSRRFFHGPVVPPPPAKVRDTDELLVRLPRSYSARTPAGILIWCDADDSSRLPASLYKACDELNLILAGFSQVGNDRPIADRLQRALDAWMTVGTRFHTDRRRVYATGISGGAKVATMLWAGCPDVFTGAVPVVGLAYWEAAPAETGKSFPAVLGTPPADLARLLKPHRLFAVTGDKDFNQLSVENIGKLMAKAGWAVRTRTEPGMAHQMGSPDVMLESLRWIDEPAREAEAKEAADAQALLDRVKASLNGVAPGTKTQAELRSVIEKAPWSAPAWEAVKLLDPK